MQQSEKVVSTQSSGLSWEQEREKFIGREKELRDNLNELEAVGRKNNLECQRLKEDKAALTKKCKEIFDEHQYTLQGLFNSRSSYFLIGLPLIDISFVLQRCSN